MKKDLCPLPYEEVLEDIIKTVWTEQCHECGNLKEMRYLGKAALVCPWLKFCLPTLHLWGAPRLKMEVSWL